MHVSSTPSISPECQSQAALSGWPRTPGGQGSSRLLSMIGANALLEIEPGEQQLPAGAKVPALLTGELSRVP
jgi:molybdopterin molybdotransferase